MFPALYVHFLIVAKIGMHNGIEKNLAYLAGIWQIKPDNKKMPVTIISGNGHFLF